MRPSSCDTPFWPGHVDSHVHLDQLRDPLGSLARAEVGGLRWMVAVATGQASLERTLSIIQNYRGAVRILLAAGIHPERTPPDRAECAVMQSALADLARRGQLAAVGEIGLPSYTPLPPAMWPAARDRFQEQLCWAAEWGLPVILHAVHAAASPALEILAEFPSSLPRVLWHWLKAPAGTLEAIAQAGHFAGFTPELAELERDRQAALRFPPDRVLPETDAPWPHRPRTRLSEPGDVGEATAALAAIWNVTELEARERASKNFCRFFSL